MAARLAASTSAGEIVAKTRSLKYEMMMGEAKKVSADAARTSAPVSVAVTMVVPRAKLYQAVDGNMAVVEAPRNSQADVHQGLHT